MDAADLFLVLMSEIRRKDSKALEGIALDEDSIEIQGNSIRFCSFFVVIFLSINLVHTSLLHKYNL